MSDQSQPIIEIVLVTDAPGVSPTRFIVGRTTFDNGLSDIEPKTVSCIEKVDAGNYIVYFESNGQRFIYREIYRIPVIVKHETRNLSQPSK